jgi:hypothetical protein
MGLLTAQNIFGDYFNKELERLDRKEKEEADRTYNYSTLAVRNHEHAIEQARLDRQDARADARAKEEFDARHTLLQAQEKRAQEAYDKGLAEDKALRSFIQTGEEGAITGNTIARESTLGAMNKAVLDSNALKGMEQNLAGIKEQYGEDSDQFKTAQKAVTESLGNIIYGENGKEVDKRAAEIKGTVTEEDILAANKQPLFKKAMDLGVSVDKLENAVNFVGQGLLGKDPSIMSAAEKAEVRKLALERAKEVFDSKLDTLKAFKGEGIQVRLDDNGLVELAQKDGKKTTLGGSAGKGGGSNISNAAKAVSDMYKEDGTLIDSAAVDFVQNTDSAVKAAALTSGMSEKDLRAAIDDDFGISAYAGKWTPAQMTDELVKRATEKKASVDPYSAKGLDIAGALSAYEAALSAVPSTFASEHNKSYLGYSDMLRMPTEYQSKPLTTAQIDKYHLNATTPVKDSAGNTINVPSRFTEKGGDTYYNDLVKSMGFTNAAESRQGLTPPSSGAAVSTTANDAIKTALSTSRSTSGATDASKGESYASAMPQSKEEYNSVLQNVLTNPKLSQEQRVAAVKELQSFASDPKNFGRVTMSVEDQNTMRNAVAEENRARPINAVKSAQELLDGAREPSDYLGVETYKTDKEGKLLVGADGYPVRDVEAEKLKTALRVGGTASSALLAPATMSGTTGFSLTRPILSPMVQQAASGGLLAGSTAAAMADKNTVSENAEDIGWSALTGAGIGGALGSLEGALAARAINAVPPGSNPVAVKGVIDDIQNKGLPIPFTDTRLPLPVKGITSMPSEDAIKQAVYLKGLSATDTDLTALRNSATLKAEETARHAETLAELKAADVVAKGQLEAFKGISRDSLQGSKALSDYDTNLTKLTEAATKAADDVAAHENSLSSLRLEATGSANNLRLAEAQAKNNELEYSRQYVAHMVKHGVLPKSALKPYENVAPNTRPTGTTTNTGTIATTTSNTTPTVVPNPKQLPGVSSQWETKEKRDVTILAQGALKELEDTVKNIKLTKKGEIDKRYKGTETTESIEAKKEKIKALNSILNRSDKSRPLTEEEVDKLKELLPKPTH